MPMKAYAVVLGLLGVCLVSALVCHDKTLMQSVTRRVSTVSRVTPLHMRVNVVVGEGEPIDAALLRFKKEVSKSGHLYDLRVKRFHENSQDERKRKRESAIRRNRMARSRARKMGFSDIYIPPPPRQPMTRMTQTGAIKNSLRERAGQDDVSFNVFGDFQDTDIDMEFENEYALDADFEWIDEDIFQNPEEDMEDSAETDDYQGDDEASQVEEDDDQDITMDALLGSQPSP